MEYSKGGKKKLCICFPVKKTGIYPELTYQGRASQDIMHPIPEKETYGLTLPYDTVMATKTIMCQELSDVLSRLDTSFSPEKIRDIIIAENVIKKETMKNRVGVYQGLKKLYALDFDVEIFRDLFCLYKKEEQALPFLSLITALARDAFLLETQDFIRNLPEGNTITSTELADWIEKLHPERYNIRSRISISQNILSSWSKAGFFERKRSYVKTRPKLLPESLALLVKVAYVDGYRGNGMLTSSWFAMLGMTLSELVEALHAPARKGYISFRSFGGITEVEPEAFI